MLDTPRDADLVRLHAAHVRHLERAYAEVMERLGLDALVLHSGSLHLRSAFDDQYWPLRVVPHFAHWLPLAHPDSAMVIVPGRRAQLVWARSSSFWESPALPEWDGWRAALDVKEVDGPRAVKDLLPRGRRAFIGDGAIALDWGFASAECNPVEATRALDHLRVTKTDYEIACLAEANRRAAVGHARVAEAFAASDRSELELHLLYLAATAQDDPETPYKNIVAEGAHAATLHHIDYSRHKTTAQSLLLDAGATFLGYASDITRTHVKRGATSAATTTFAQLLEGMDKLQKHLCADVQINKPYEALHEASHRLVAELLREAGLVKLSVEEADARGVTRAFFPHGLGHSLGLQTHDVGCAEIKPRARNPFLRNTTTIAAGQVFTVEPGLYFIDGLLEPLRASPEGSAVSWPLVDALRPLGGIRIEDDLLVGAAGTRNLTREVLPS